MQPWHTNANWCLWEDRWAWHSSMASASCLQRRQRLQLFVWSCSSRTDPGCCQPRHCWELGIQWMEHFPLLNFQSFLVIFWLEQKHQRKLHLWNVLKLDCYTDWLNRRIYIRSVRFMTTSWICSNWSPQKSMICSVYYESHHFHWDNLRFYSR